MSLENRAARAAQSGMQLSDERFTSLTSQLKLVYDRIDGALAQTMRLNAEMIETAQEIGQKLFAEIAESVGTMMASREKMVAAHTRATAIRMRTSQAARADGCWPWKRVSASDGEDVRSHLRIA